MPYLGGKSRTGTYHKIINLMPPHEVYIEPFLGGGAILRLKRPAPRNIALDLDTTVTIAWPKKHNTQILTSDGTAFLKTYRFTGRELVYCDPPYLRSTRRDKRQYYRHEMTEQQHAQLIATIKHLPCMVLISGYHSTLYTRELADWNTTSFQTITRGGTQATEYLWFNYPPPIELHDYRYLGDNFRERERIKRKKLRWTERLNYIPILERQALLAAMRETPRISHRHNRR